MKNNFFHYAKKKKKKDKICCSMTVSIGPVPIYASGNPITYF